MPVNRNTIIYLFTSGALNGSITDAVQEKGTLYQNYKGLVAWAQSGHGSVVVSTSTWHAAGRGSIPARTRRVILGKKPGPPH